MHWETFRKINLRGGICNVLSGSSLSWSQWNSMGKWLRFSSTQRISSHLYGYVFPKIQDSPGGINWQSSLAGPYEVYSTGTISIDISISEPYSWHCWDWDRPQVSMPKFPKQSWITIRLSGNVYHNSSSMKHCFKETLTCKGYWSMFMKTSWISIGKHLKYSAINVSSPCARSTTIPEE